MNSSSAILRRRMIHGLIVVLGLAFTVFRFAPLLWNILTSLKPTGEILTNPPQRIPGEFSFEHYVRVMEKPNEQWTFNSLYISLISTFMTLVLGAAAGYAFARLEFFGRNVPLPAGARVVHDAVRGDADPPVPHDGGPRPRRVALVHHLPLGRRPVLGIPVPSILPRHSARAGGRGRDRRRGPVHTIHPHRDAAPGSGMHRGRDSRLLRELQPIYPTAHHEHFGRGEDPPVGIAQFAPSLQGSTNITQYYGMGAAAATLMIGPSLIVFLLLQRFFMRNLITSGRKG